MSKTCRTFIRSARNFQEFSRAEKQEIDTGLTISEAQDQCSEFNSERSEAEIAAGTKMEFEEE